MAARPQRFETNFFPCRIATRCCAICAPDRPSTKAIASAAVRANRMISSAKRTSSKNAMLSPRSKHIESNQIHQTFPKISKMISTGSLRTFFLNRMRGDTATPSVMKLCFISKGSAVKNSREKMQNLMLAHQINIMIIKCKIEAKSSQPERPWASPIDRNSRNSLGNFRRLCPWNGNRGRGESRASHHFPQHFLLSRGWYTKYL